MSESLAETPAIAEITPETTSEVSPGAAESAPAADTGEPERDKVQERINKITREKYDFAYRAESAEARASRLEAEIESLRTAKTEPVAPDEYPKLADYDFDEAKHQVAVAKYIANLSSTTAKTVLQQEREAVARAERAATFEKREADFIASKPDYVEKVRRSPAYGGPVITNEMAEVIRESDVGPQIAYYLADNVERSAAISRLSPLAQAREIGRIEARLEVEKAKPPAVSKAPPPPPKIEAIEPAVEKSPSEMSDTEFAKWRKRQIAQRR